MEDGCLDLLVEALLRIPSLLERHVVDSYVPAAPPVGAGDTAGTMLKVQKAGIFTRNAPGLG